MNIDKNKIFSFLKRNILNTIGDDCISIEETKNSENSSNLRLVKINNLNDTSKYWVLNPENNTFLESKKKKVERIIIEHTENNKVRIIMIEMKSKTVKKSDVEEKFEHSLEWVYLLLLLEHDNNAEIEVYGIVVSQKQNIRWANNTRSELDILDNVAVRYDIKSFYTNINTCEIDFQNIIARSN